MQTLGLRDWPRSKLRPPKFFCLEVFFRKLMESGEIVSGQTFLFFFFAFITIYIQWQYLSKGQCKIKLLLWPISEIISRFWRKKWGLRETTYIRLSPSLFIYYAAFLLATIWVNTFVFLSVHWQACFRRCPKILGYQKSFAAKKTAAKNSWETLFFSERKWYFFLVFST